MNLNTVDITTVRPPVIDAPTAMQYLGGISRTALWRLAQAGDITAVNVGSRRVYLVESLDNFIARATSTQ